MNRTSCTTNLLNQVRSTTPGAASSSQARSGWAFATFRQHIHVELTLADVASKVVQALQAESNAIVNFLPQGK